MNLNKCMFCGKVSGTPVVHGDGDNKRADINFVVSERKPDANGQWVEEPMTAPVYAFGKKADVVQNYVVDGQELILETKYSSWKNQDGSLGFGFIVINLELGFKPRANTGGGGGAPAGGPPGGPPM